MMCRGRQIQERNAGSRPRGSYCAVYQRRVAYETASVMRIVIRSGTVRYGTVRYGDTECVPYAMGAIDLPQTVHQQSRT